MGICDTIETLIYAYLYMYLNVMTVIYYLVQTYSKGINCNYVIILEDVVSEIVVVGLKAIESEESESEIFYSNIIHVQFMMKVINLLNTEVMDDFC